MDIMELGAIGELVGGVAVIASLVYVGAQIRHNTKAVSAATFQAVSSASAQISLHMSESPEVQKLFLAPETLSREESFRVGLKLRAAFRNYENYLYQVENGLLDRDVYEGYHNTIVDVLRNPFVREWWPAQREGYGPVFRAAIDRLVPELDSTRSVWEDVADVSLPGQRQ